MMASSFEMMQLGNVIRFGNGKAIKPGGVGRYPVFGSNGIIGHSDEFRYENGIVIGRVGAYCGSVEYCSEKFWASDNTLVAFPANDQFDTRFLYYLLHNAKLSAYAGGAAQPLVTQTVLKQVEVNVPPLHIQHRIAGIFAAYDELIENNQRRIRILEDMARSLYREWFVHFRYPGHETVHLVDSPFGQIPQGWDVLEFRSVFEIKYGKTLPKTEISESGQYPVYGAGDVIGYYDKLLCPQKCALVTSRGNGSGTVWRTRGAAFVTNNSLIIVPQKQVGFWGYPFIELLLKHSNVMAAKTGSAQPQVTIENLSYIQAIVPLRELVEKFCAFAIPIYEQVDSLFEKCSKLRRTRDLLLPRLLSGGINVQVTNQEQCHVQME